MGPVASKAQLRDVRKGIAILSEAADVLCGGPDPVDGELAPQGKGYYIAPTLLKAKDSDHELFHQLEVFGPCATIGSWRQWLTCSIVVTFCPISLSSR